MKRTLLTIGLSAMLVMPVLAGGQKGSTTAGTSGSGTRMEQLGQQAMTPEQIREAQRQLKEAGFDPGPIDGQLGHRTTEAIREYQKDNGLPQTGQLDEPTKELLMAQKTERSPSGMESPRSPMPGQSSRGESSSGGTMGSGPSPSGRLPNGPMTGGSGGGTGSGTGTGSGR